MPRVFICYRREDSGGYAGRIYDRLKDRLGGENVFRDIDSIGLGEDFVKVVEKTIASCDAFVAIVGKRWLDVDRLKNRNDFVRLELETAIAEGIKIFPVLVDGG